MWDCKVCEVVIEDDSWDNCWKCSSSKDLPESEVEERRQHIGKSMICLRCGSEMRYAGTKKFHEGTRLGVLGDLGELFVDREVYDVYFCTNCGKVELYIDGIGNEQRDETTQPEPNN